MRVIRSVQAVATGEKTALDPVVQPLRTGFFLDVRPRLVGDGQNLELEIFAIHSTVTEPRATEWTEGKPFVIHRYAERNQDLSTSVFLPDGATVALVRRPDPDQPGHTRVYLISPRVVRIRG